MAPKFVVVSKAKLIPIYIFQRALRLADAKAVEAKAARIKEWVTNKLRELEEQNVHLKVQNAKANDQMELLRNRLEQLQVLGATTTKSRQSSMAEVRKLLKHRVLVEFLSNKLKLLVSFSLYQNKLNFFCFFDKYLTKYQLASTKLKT